MGSNLVDIQLEANDVECRLDIENSRVEDYERASDVVTTFQKPASLWPLERRQPTAIGIELETLQKEFK